jgi:hypothetical protein
MPQRLRGKGVEMVDECRDPARLAEEKENEGLAPPPVIAPGTGGHDDSRVVSFPAFRPWDQVLTGEGATTVRAGATVCASAVDETKLELLTKLQGGRAAPHMTSRRRGVRNDLISEMRAEERGSYGRSIGRCGANATPARSTTAVRSEPEAARHQRETSAPEERRGRPTTASPRFRAESVFDAQKARREDRSVRRSAQYTTRRR